MNYFSFKYTPLIIFSLIIITLLIVNYFHELYIRENTINSLCQEEKSLRLEEKGYFSDKLNAKKYLEKEFPEISYAKVIYSTSNPEDFLRYPF